MITSSEDIRVSSVKPWEQRLANALRLPAGQVASALRRLRNLPEAGEADPELLREAGIELVQSKNPAAAREVLEWASSLRLNAATDHVLATVYLGDRDLQRALDATARAVAADESYAPAWQTMSAVLLTMGEMEGAEIAAKRALALDNSLDASLEYLCAALGRQHKFREAAVYLGAAVESRPESGPLWFALGGTLSSLNEFERSVHCFRKALEIDPGNAAARIQLGNTLVILSREDDARREFELARDGQNDAVVNLRCAQLLSPMPDSTEQILRERVSLGARIEDLMRSAPRLDELPTGLSATNFFLAYHGMNDRPLQEAWSKLLLRVAPSLKFIAPHCREPKMPNGRIRIAFISNYLKDHTIARFTSGILRHLPRDRFDVTAFDLSPFEDTTEIENLGVRVIRPSGAIQNWIQRLASERFDVAFFPDLGMNPDTYLLAFNRFAPVQCTTWGHPVTTGLPEIDYFLSSELIEPENADSHYSEHLVRLRRLPTCYDRPTGEIEKFSLPQEWHSYFCPQSLFKFHPDFDDIVGEILERDPAGYMLILTNGQQYLERFKARLARKYPRVLDRLLPFSQMPRELLLSMMKSSTVMLDTHPFGGGNTTYEALSYGTPIITRAGEFMRGRVTLGCYRQMGFEECVASTTEEYVERALRAGKDRDYRAWLAHEIRTRNETLYGDVGVVQEMANFLEQAVRKACAG